MSAPYDFNKYNNETNQTLAVKYGVSLSTFKKNKAAIQPKLEALRKKIRPDSKLGVRFWTDEMLGVLFDHIGEPHFRADGKGL